MTASQTQPLKRQLLSLLLNCRYLLEATAIPGSVLTSPTPERQGRKEPKTLQILSSSLGSFSARQEGELERGGVSLSLGLGSEPWGAPQPRVGSHPALPLHLACSPPVLLPWVNMPIAQPGGSLNLAHPWAQQEASSVPAHMGLRFRGKEQPFPQPGCSLIL